MNLFKKLAIYLCILLFVFSCERNTKKEDKEKNNVEKPTTNSGDIDVRREAITKDKANLKHALSHLIVNEKALPFYNRMLLKEILAEMNDTTKGENKLEIDAPLVGVFILKQGEMGIFSEPRYSIEEENGRVVIVSGEEKFITDYNGNDSEKEVKVKGATDSIFKHKERNRYLYSFNKIYLTKIGDLFYYKNCLDYYRYSFKMKKINDKMLIGSKYPIKIETGSYPQIDSLIKRKYREDGIVEDCPSSYHLAQTFAKLKGTDNIYFVYADTFPLNDGLDTPFRGLIWVENSRFYYIWMSSIDLFGCKCL